METHRVAPDIRIIDLPVLFTRFFFQTLIFNAHGSKLMNSRHKDVKL